MSDIFGAFEQVRTIFSGLFFIGPIAYMDFRKTSFRTCTFQNCEWINCEADSSTEFRDCVFKGRFGQIQSGGLRSAVYSPLTDTNVDKDARIDLEKLLDRPPMISVTRENIINMLTTLLEQFRGAGFYMPRTRDQLNIRFIGAPIVREHIIGQLIAHEVLEEKASRGLQVVKKNSASVTALLDNGTLNGAVHSAANEVIKRFKPGAVVAG